MTMNKMRACFNICFFCLFTCVFSVGQAKALTYRNCTLNWQVATPPQRIVALNQHAADIVIALGGKKRLIGVSWIDDDPSANKTGFYKGIPVLSKKYPSIEVLLAREVDFAVAGFASAFIQGQGAGDRAMLKEEGIGTYLLESYCQETQEKSKISRVLHDISELSKILGNEELGAKVTQNLRGKLEEAKTISQGLSKKPSVFIWDSEMRSPKTEGVDSFMNEVLKVSGGRSVFEDLSGDMLSSVSWEDVIDRDPDVILMYDATWSTAKAKKEFLAQDPALSELSAVKAGRVFSIDFSQAVPTVTVGETAVEIAKHLAKYSKALLQDEKNADEK